MTDEERIKQLELIVANLSRNYALLRKKYNQKAKHCDRLLKQKRDSHLTPPLRGEE